MTDRIRPVSIYVSLQSHGGDVDVDALGKDAAAVVEHFPEWKGLSALEPGLLLPFGTYGSSNSYLSQRFSAAYIYACPQFSLLRTELAFLKTSHRTLLYVFGSVHCTHALGVLEKKAWQHENTSL